MPWELALPLVLGEVNEAMRRRNRERNQVLDDPIRLTLLSWKELGVRRVSAPEPLQGSVFACRVHNPERIEWALLDITGFSWVVKNSVIPEVTTSDLTCGEAEAPLDVGQVGARASRW